MNSLEQLNNYANTIVTANDERLFPYAEYEANLGTLGISVDEGGTFLLKNILGTFLELQATETGTANVVTVVFDLSNSIGQAAEVNWGTSTPSSVTRSDTGGVWTATNILNTSDYDLLIDNNAYIEFIDQDVNFTFSATVSYPSEFGTVSYVRTCNVVIGTTTDEMSFTPTTSQEISVNEIQVLGNGPQVTDTTASPNATYTMIVNPSTSGVVDFQIAQSFAYSNSGANGISIGPFSKSTMNTNLVDIDLQGIGANPTDITFELTNNLSGVVSNGTMTGLLCETLNGFSSGSTTTRTYTENTINTNLFASGPPVVSPFVESTFGDGTYKVIVNAGTNGRLRADTTSTPTSSVSLTDTTANLNTWLANNIQYIPDAGTSSTQNMSIEIQRTNGFVIDNDPFDATGTANPGALPEEGIFDANFQIIDITDNIRFFLKVDVLLVGAGGWGGEVSGGTPTFAAGGGGAGGTLFFEDIPIFDTNTGIEKIRSYGGFVLNPGQAGSSAFLEDYTGNTVVSALAEAKGGGAGGNGGFNPGIAGVNGGFGGGGGGYNGAGGSAVANVVASGMGTPVSNRTGAGQQASQPAPGGDGGGSTGYTSDISGTSVTYGYAGPGGGSLTTLFTTPGSGGHGQSKSNTNVIIDGQTSGQAGKAIVRIYQ